MKRTLIALAAVAVTAFNATADANENTDLMVAAAHGDTAAVRTMIEAGADVNAKGRIGNTALIYAAQQGQIEVVALLIKAGADATAANDYNATAQSLAEGYGHRQIAEQVHTATLQATADHNDDVL